MTDRYTGLVVVLSEPLRDDDAEGLIEAISRLRGVADVKPVTSEPFAESIAVQRRDLQWREALLDLGASGPAGNDEG